MLAGNKRRYQIHWTRSIERVEGDQVLQPAGPCIAQHALHTSAFELEHRLCLTTREQRIHLRVVDRDRLKTEIGLPRVPRPNEVASQLQNGQRCQPQKVKLNQADVFHIVFVKLTHRRITTGLLVQRAEISQLTRGDQHTPSVHADVSSHAFELLRHVQQRTNVFLTLQALCQLRFLLDRLCDGDVGARLVWDQLGDPIAKAIGKVHHTPDVSNRCTRRH